MKYVKTKRSEVLKELADPQLLAYATTDAERRALKAVVKFGGYSAAARELRCSNQAVHVHVQNVRRKAALQGYSPPHDWTHEVPEPHHVKGVSTLYDGDGAVRQQWVKSDVRKDQTLANIRAALQAWADPFTGGAKPTPAPKYADDQLLTLYPIGDHHLGMFSWKEETGYDHDLKEGERLLMSAFDHLVAASPPSQKALIVDIGDFFHADSKDNRTAASGHPLDVDTRWAKVFQVGARLMRYAIDRALTKHAEVQVVFIPGNHDEHSATLLALVTAAFYSNEPRVFVDTSACSALRQYVVHGRVLFCFDHGDKLKAERLAGIIPNERKDVWSDTVRCYAYRGHIHHEVVRDFPGVRVENLRVLPPPDAWHVGAGYVGNAREMSAVVFHKAHGQCARFTVPAEVL